MDNNQVQMPQQLPGIPPSESTPPQKSKIVIIVLCSVIGLLVLSILGGYLIFGNNGQKNSPVSQDISVAKISPTDLPILHPTVVISLGPVKPLTKDLTVIKHPKCNFTVPIPSKAYKTNQDGSNDRNVPINSWAYFESDHGIYIFYKDPPHPGASPPSEEINITCEENKGYSEGDIRTKYIKEHSDDWTPVHPFYMGNTTLWGENVIVMYNRIGNDALPKDDLSIDSATTFFVLTPKYIYEIMKGSDNMDNDTTQTIFQNITFEK